ncbi:hypothetical protein LRAMOSA05988 [Lichtheimia ramosa]|uniref:Glycoside hydrolase family 20 catalytic domain-containing protein n=1 Tax=Lichtheimia ramosa TaxID=688394 RepID=A0A077X2W6_9FUNG|nr:hypothetical protein LRAMOSA05988 [Lichtheimia ramosa]
MVVMVARGVLLTRPGKILGIEVAFWTKQGGPSVLDSKLWPRSGVAAAEITWSGAYDNGGYWSTDAANHKFKRLLIKSGLTIDGTLYAFRRNYANILHKEW